MTSFGCRRRSEDLRAISKEPRAGSPEQAVVADPSAKQAWRLISEANPLSLIIHRAIQLK